MATMTSVGIPPQLLCPTCGKVGEFVNQCGCDPNNMPTAIPTTTPRPWKARMELDGGTVIYGADGTPVCAAAYYTDGRNVALLEAAPELLERLRELIDRLDIVRLRGYVGHPLVTAAREAIAKAEGSAAQ